MCRKENFGAALDFGDEQVSKKLRSDFEYFLAVLRLDLVEVRFRDLENERTNPITRKHSQKVML